MSAGYTILFTLQLIILCIFGSFTIYLALLSFLALISRQKRILESSHLRQIAVIVPAHNEEMTIEKTIRSIYSVNYPRTHYDVIVIADNCTDQTAEICRTAGATVLERTDPTQRGKGYALRWCIDIILWKEPRYNAFIVIDADSTISQNFLSIMNYYLEKGSKAIQSSDMVEPKPGVWSSETIRLGFTLYNYVRPLGRSVLNLSAGIRGNGMCFARETLESIPWDSYSLNEDLEYGLNLLLKGINVDFAPEAEVLATMPVHASNAETQRARWETGRFPIIKNYAFKLLINSIRQFSFRLFDAFIDLIIPPLVMLIGILLSISSINLLLFLFGVESAAQLLIICMIFLGAGISHIIVGLYAAKADKSLYKVFYYIPKYALWKIALYFKILQDDSKKDWIRTTREKVTPTSENR